MRLSMFLYMNVCLSVFLSVYLSIHLSVCPSVCACLYVTLTVDEFRTNCACLIWYDKPQYTRVQAAREAAKSNLYAPGGGQTQATPVMPSSLPLALPAVTSEEDAINTLFESVAQSATDSTSESAMKAAAALCFLDDFYGCTPTTRLPPSPSSVRTRGREQGWEETQTPIQTGVCDWWYIDHIILYYVVMTKLNNIVTEVVSLSMHTVAKVKLKGLLFHPWMH